MSLHAIEEITNQTGAVLQSDGKLHVANYVWDTTGLTWARATQAGGGGGGAGDASAANQVAQIALETTIRDDTALIADTVINNELTVNPQATGTAFWPGYKGVSDTSRDGLSYDPGGALITRGAVTTDEGTFRVNFANTSLAVSLGSVTVSGNTVTGSGFLAADVNYHDYFKLDADAESAWAQIDYVVNNTTIILAAAYTGGASGAASRALVVPITQAGGGYSVASGQLTITSGTTSGGGVIIGRVMDYGPLVYRARVSISQRVANNETRIGFAEPVTVTQPRWTARFIADGTVNTTIKCESSRNPTTQPSAAETETTTVTIPNGGTTAQLLDYRVEQLTESVRFYISGVLVAEHSKVMPAQSDVMVASVRSFNSAVPASSTTVIVDFMTVKNHNKLEIGVMSETEKMLAAAVPLQSFTYSVAGVIAINTDLIVMDCSQLRSLFIQCNSMGTTGVVTTQWSNTPDFAQPITATLMAENGTVSTTFNAAGMRVTNVLARYCRHRLTTATTAGTTTLNVWGSQAAYVPVTMPITGAVTASGTVTANLGAATTRAGFMAGAGIWYDDSSTVLAGAATFTGTSRDLTVTATATAMANAATYAQEVRVSAESDQSGTLWVEYSRDNTNWRRAKSAATAAITGGAQFAEIVLRPSWRYIRVGFTNGATLQTRFTINSLLMAV
jgi:hypothetical protein